MITNDDIEGMNDGQMPEVGHDTARDYGDDLHWRYNFEVAIKHENEQLRERIDAAMKIINDQHGEIAALWSQLSRKGD